MVDLLDDSLTELYLVKGVQIEFLVQLKLLEIALDNVCHRHRVWKLRVIRALVETISREGGIEKAASRSLVVVVEVVANVVFANR